MALFGLFKMPLFDLPNPAQRMVSKRKERGDRTLFFWGKMAEIDGEHLSKGPSAYVGEARNHAPHFRLKRKHICAYDSTI
jgi:hypothetical protein